MNFKYKDNHRFQTTGKRKRSIVINHSKNINAKAAVILPPAPSNVEEIDEYDDMDDHFDDFDDHPYDNDETNWTIRQKQLDQFWDELRPNLINYILKKMDPYVECLCQEAKEHNITVINYKSKTICMSY